MKNMMEYKEYYGSVHYSDEDQIFYGKLEYIRSLVSYEGESVVSLRKAFEEAVDDYLTTAKKQGVPPEIPFKGTFNVRVSSDLHRKAALIAQEDHTTLNNVVAKALKDYLEKGRHTGSKNASTLR